MTFLSLFAGIGGFDLGLERAGMRCIGQVEIDPFCRAVLKKHWPNVPRFEDVRTFKKEMLPETPDVICGGFPCQDISNAGHKRGLAGERSGLWSEYFRILCDIRPRFAIVENVAALLVRGIGTVLGDLAQGGFDAEWSIVPACAMGAPHTRERLFIVAYPNSFGRDGSQIKQTGQHFTSNAITQSFSPVEVARCDSVDGGKWWVREPSICRVVDGPASRVGNPNRAIGRAVVPQVAEFIGKKIIALDSAFNRIEVAKCA